MRIVFVASGSKGNATLIESGSTLIQIDMGIPLKRLKAALSAINHNVNNIEGCFFTHDHTDHIGQADLLKGKTPLYATEGTLDGKEDYIIEPGEAIDIGDFMVMPFPVSHDAIKPVNFLISDGKTKLGYVTDAGELDESALQLLKNCDYYLFESNHDLKMLMKSHRPLTLKNRIRGDHGHLSNVDSALYMAEIMGDKTKAIYLAHISEECNTPELAVREYRRILQEKGKDVDSISIIPTKQWDYLIGGDPE